MTGQQSHPRFYWVVRIFETQVSKGKLGMRITGGRTSLSTVPLGAHKDSEGRKIRDTKGQTEGCFQRHVFFESGLSVNPRRSESVQRLSLKRVRQKQSVPLTRTELSSPQWQIAFSKKRRPRLYSIGLLFQIMVFGWILINPDNEGLNTETKT